MTVDQVSDRDRELLELPLPELLAAARERRDRAHGSRVTYSPKVFIPLTMLCRDRCGYCTFAQPPARLAAPYLLPEEVLDIARRGASVGCHEALFTLGERPEERYPVAKDWLNRHGYNSTIDYLADVSRLVLEETGLLPHSNAGALFEDELAQLREVSASQGMMIETLRPDLDCHRGAPDKLPERRLATLEAAGRLHIPFTTGILVGIGEGRIDRIVALEAIAESHRRHGHVQEVIVQNFLPKAGTAMHAVPPCPEHDYLEAIALARLVLPDAVHVQAPPNLSDDFGPLLEAGIDDWGGVSPVTADHVNPERPWPALDRLRAEAEKHGFALAPGSPSIRSSCGTRRPGSTRRCASPSWTGRMPRASDGTIRARSSPSASRPSPQRTVQRSARSGTTRRPGTRVRLCRLPTCSGARRPQGAASERSSTAYSKARRPEPTNSSPSSLHAARRLAVGGTVTWVANRNINYTNVCTYKCRFCGFSKGPLSLNLRGTPYLLDIDEIAGRAADAARMGATEVCLQGGIHPNFDGDFYIDVTRAVRDAVPNIHVHGFTALEVTEGARRLGEPLEDYLRRLMDAGLSSLPGTAAEILDDGIRAELCPDKINTEEWLEAHRTAHRVGLRSNITIMFGSIEGTEHWVRHLLVCRDLQKETGGFTEFVGLPFVHMASPIYLQRRARRGPTFRETLLMHAVARIALHGLIDNIQGSWVKIGFDGIRQMLQAGCNDLGGTLVDENISRAAGAEHGQSAHESDFRTLVEPLGRTLAQRSTLYGSVAVGSRLDVNRSDDGRLLIPVVGA